MSVLCMSSAKAHKAECRANKIALHGDVSLFFMFSAKKVVLFLKCKDAQASRRSAM